MIAVKDLVAHLLTLPQDLEVWSVWDESGEYTPFTEPPGRIDAIAYLKAYNDERRWEMPEDGTDPAPPRKSVVVLLPKQHPL